MKMNQHLVNRFFRIQNPKPEVPRKKPVVETPYIQEIVPVDPKPILEIPDLPTSQSYIEDILFQPNYRWSKAHPPSQVIGNPSALLRTRRQIINEYMHASFISQMQPKKIEKYLSDPSCIEAMK